MSVEAAENSAFNVYTMKKAPNVGKVDPNVRAMLMYN
jgi:hypothetical protein